MEVAVRINTDTPRGRKLIRELDNNKHATVDYPLPAHLAGTEIKENVREVFDELMDNVNAHYGTDYELDYTGLE